MNTRELIVLTIVLTEFAVLSSLLLFYTFPEKNKPTKKKVINSLITNHVFWGVLSLLGLLISEHLGQVPRSLLSLLYRSRGYASSFPYLELICIGIACGLILILLDKLLFKKVSNQLVETEIGKSTIPQRLSAIPHAAIGEEIVFRLAIQSLLSAIFIWLIGNGATVHSYAVMCPAILITSLLFGSAHLPITKRFIKLSTGLIARALFLNGLAGVVLGFVYVQKGLEAAMFVHLCIDLCIVLAPVLIVFLFRTVNH